MSGKSPESALKVIIGDVCLALLMPNAKILRTLRFHYREYLTDAQADIVINAQEAVHVERPLESNVLMRGLSWELYQKDGELGIYFLHETNPSLAIFNARINRIDFFSRRLNPSLFLCLLPELVLGLTLHLHNALLVHACGLIINNTGCLFVAASGGGKSTLARLANKAGFTLLNDDRVIIRVSQGISAMHSTPWHGEVRQTSNIAIPLGYVFFLEKSNRISIAPVNISMSPYLK